MGFFLKKCFQKKHLDINASKNRSIDCTEAKYKSFTDKQIYENIPLNH